MSTHPSKDIIGTKGEELKGKKIALCITSSIAASECPKIARELMRHGAEVYTVMSKKAQEIIHPNLMEWATGNPVVTELTGKIEHVSLAGIHENKVDLILVSPSTANTISKIACGIDDTPVTTVVSTAFGSKIPIIIVPAMHESLYYHPIVIENIKKLESLGVEFINPRIEEGKAKMASLDDIVEVVIRRLSIKSMRGIKMLVTAGPTLEYIDPIRIITNKSSGKMGVAIANEALRRGADVTLIYGHGIVSPPQGARVISVETTEEMYNEVISELKAKDYNVLIATSAVTDFIPEKKYDYKLPSREIHELSIKLKPLPKMIDKVKELSLKTFLVAFKADYGLSDEELIDSAYGLLKASNADLVVANDVSRKGSGFRVDTNEVFIVDRARNAIHIPLSSKQAIASNLLDIIIKSMKEK
ncbi:MAG: bifunctional phosphopantothenoylcysteine decarboxylase/phosphopantothenate--cysteine ligase CoaBC [archaeon]|nr:bifunctional phosphopantothenoylcysteine decarboxylase/phosphopantothenate--cysteine ligase CoaBC [archaeon]MCP8314085.1 bifunctional phosphopantothenoylcysteine decarboxylase/phosphopantothenate--cysteine ligase CoaBC [archaeon]MCP8318101.1 bifunctional phosphopantothenoylcysteine decarboxylase/phosphopantothenate--cysteine ligase CoaBC [archaeon]MCP8322111.1 bifunctional phosphopantothenoylcysteine decarboxylase/phosphopantothenate--cysteine ligase CoaBC [archaeon]